MTSKAVRDRLSALAAELGKHGGKAGRGDAKRRGDSDYYKSLRGRSVVYCVTWREAVDTDIQPPTNLPARTTLSNVIFICKTYGLAAILTDAPGFSRGRVNSDGSYSLR